MTSQSNRRALVCGASSGIGRATAFALATRGLDLVLLARSREKLASLAAELTEDFKSISVQTIVADLMNRPVVSSAVQLELEARGPIQILVNNSGGPSSGPLLEAQDADFLNAFEQHVLASHLLVRLLLPGMLHAGYGRIVNVISTSVREPIAGLGVSNTVRAAMAGWAKTLSQELPPKVTINNILPGFTETERLDYIKNITAQRQNKTPEQIEELWKSYTPEGRLAQPREIAEVIAFLASPEAGYVRGVSLAVDGGRTRSI